MSKRAKTLLAALHAGFTFGYSNKEGMMSVSFHDGVYSFYAGGEGGYEEREKTSDPAAFVRYLASARGGSLSGSVYEKGFTAYLCSLGYLAVESGDLDTAEANFEQAIRWGYQIAQVGMALLATERDDNAQALNHLAELDTFAAKNEYRFNPFGPVEAFFSAACTNIYKETRYERMRAFWTRILTIQPTRPDALYGRGFANEMLEDWAAASSDLQSALDNLPEGQMRDLAWQRLVRALLEQDLGSEAFDRTTEGVAESPRWGYQLRRQRVECLLRLDRPVDALAEFDRLFELAPDNYALHIQRGDVYNLLEQTEDAIADWERALALYPGSEEAMSRLESSE